MQILLIEHDEVEKLYPFSATHCSWELRVGAFTILERWQKSIPKSSLTVASHRDAHVRSFVERNPSTSSFKSVPTLVISGHLLIAPSVMQQVVATCEQSARPIVFYCNGHAVGAYHPEPAKSPLQASHQLDAVDADAVMSIELAGHVVDRLWQTIDHIEAAIAWDAALLPAYINDDANIHPSTIVDESKGPVIVMQGARVDALCVLHGPVVIGPNAIVKPHSVIGHCVIGPMCRVKGEIGETIIHGYSNKQHDGFLGHSYICEWVNLGAGTTTSDLKNTYGHINVDMPWGKENTQRMFLGLLIGDHSKSAIGTMFSTGTVCGICCNVVAEGFPPRGIKSFSWINGKNVDPYELDKAIDIASIVMNRRNVVLGPDTTLMLKAHHKQERT